MLLDDLGTEHFSEGAKGHIAVEYFRELFMSPNPYDMETLFDGLTARVSADMNRLLTRSVYDDEIRLAAFSIKGSSAPGEDGLTGLFYQKFWHIVGPELSAEIHKFFQTAILPSGWNHTQISLLPKIPSPTTMKDMRPISLCSVQYKIISKILSERLKGVLESIISDTQGAFVSGRLITDNVIIAHELVHGLRTNDSIAHEYMAVKTDMSKAYDRVEWCFLENLMEKMGFDRQWICWIMACVSTVTYSVLLNGSPHGFIRPERGLRQGDPLSPFLFIMCAEALVGCLNQSEARGKINGICLGPGGPAVHHLLFADDSLLLCRANEEESVELMRCLKLYGDASGQCINHQKSSIIFGSKVPEDKKLMVKGVLGIDKEGGEGSYLGLPECFKGSKRELLNFISEKLQSRLHGWYAQALSQGGKEILLKSVCFALPIYAMSVFRLPKDLCKKLTSVMTEFWWSSGVKKKKIAWVSWQKMCRSKEEGGLGFHDIEQFNQALLGKQAWRIWSRPDSLVARVLKSRYFRRISFLECCVGSRPSFAWRSLLFGRDLLKEGLVRDVGDGKDTNVWSEKWIIDEVPKIPMYRQDSVIDLTLRISDLLIEGSSRWNVTLVRQTFTDEDAELILKLKPHVSRRDSFKWGFTSNGCYSSQSGRRLLELLKERQQSPHVGLPPIEKRLWKAIWKIRAPQKLKHFLWRVLAGALPVKERLNTRGLHLDARCKLCNTGSESIGHLLFSCSYAKEVWERSGIQLPQNGFSRTSVFLNVYHLIFANGRRPKHTQNRAFPWVLWEIWKARNALVFENVQTSPSTVATKAIEEADEWFDVNFKDQQAPTATVEEPSCSVVWSPPSVGSLKCNVGISWNRVDRLSGASWIIRNNVGKALLHSRRSFSNVSSRLEAELQGLSFKPSYKA